jgi:hypothetical protein
LKSLQIFAISLYPVQLISLENNRANIVQQSLDSLMRMVETADV